MTTVIHACMPYGRNIKMKSNPKINKKLKKEKKKKKNESRLQLKNVMNQGSNYLRCSYFKRGSLELPYEGTIKGHGRQRGYSPNWNWSQHPLSSPGKHEKTLRSPHTKSRCFTPHPQLPLVIFLHISRAPFHDFFPKSRG